MTSTDIPIAYRALVDRHGPAVYVQDARARWTALVEAAESGTITLITRQPWEWAALAPMTEVAEPAAGLPVWPVPTARSKLGHLVRASDTTAQIITRHGRPVAALISAGVLDARPASAARLDARTLLHAGYKVVIEFHPGSPGTMGEFDVVNEPEPACFTATALDQEGQTVAVGAGDTMGEALLCLAAPYESPPFDDEAPF